MYYRSSLMGFLFKSLLELSLLGLVVKALDLSAVLQQQQGWLQGAFPAKPLPGAFLKALQGFSSLRCTKPSVYQAFSFHITT